ncbi:long-chain-fatty-acid--CoA ligase [Parasphingopyxis marina]|uniref:Long-chain fatty acid--CoA ligase n=1 Tax=Parasphingopyxis marina TaxID=2761622 RepID=A0A842I0R5_9SPHN|nr:long-chain fatty acid--CoA ligase [Parasphingopyxis marina]MBC2778273.1 long-chain fatty acid--CoA ligase [Parasphingopyxis marina]
MVSIPDIWRDSFQHPGLWDRSYPPLSVPQMFAESAAAHPDAYLADFMGRKFSYADVRLGVNRVARGLQQLGVKKGDRVGLFLPNVPHYLAAYYGAMKIGAIAVNFSPLYTVEELAHQVEDSGTKILVTLSASALLPTALKVLDNSSLEKLVVGTVVEALPMAKSLLFRMFQRDQYVDVPKRRDVIPFAELVDNKGDCDKVPIDPRKDIALIQYTGGTTGTPKGAMLTHQNITANARQTNDLDPDQQAEDRIIGVLPFFHVFANTTVLNRTVVRGGEIIMLPRWNAAQTLKAIERTRATALPGVPTMYTALLDHPRTAKTDFSSLRVCISGGAPLPLETKTKFETATGAKLVEGYGLTEASGVVSTNPYEGEDRPGSIGQPLAGTIVKLVDKEDPSEPATEGEPGEILVAGPQVMLGYWNRPDADEKVLHDGFLRTGDVGKIDADGYIYIVDRLKDMIAVSGYKVFPSQIEQILYKHPAVKEAIVLGVPDDYTGEKPKAFVSLQTGSETAGTEILEWLNPQLGKHEQVVAVEVRTDLPKTMVGKLDRKALRAEEGV